MKRTCHYDGKPKAAFATQKEADAAIPDNDHYLTSYACREHGWHIGHDYSLLDAGILVRKAPPRRNRRRK